MSKADIQKLESIFEDSFLECVGGLTKEKIKLKVTGVNHDYNEVYDEARRIAREINESVDIELKIITVVGNWDGPTYANLSSKRMPKRYTFDTQQSVQFFALEIAGTLKVLESLSTLCGGHGASREGVMTFITMYFGESDIKDIIIPFTIEKLLKYHIMRHNNQNYFEIIEDGHNILKYYKELKKLKPDLKIEIEEKYSQDLQKAIETVSGREEREIPSHCENIEELIEYFQNMFKDKRYKRFSEHNTGIEHSNNNQPEAFTDPVEHTCLQLLAKTLYDLSDLEISKTCFLLRSKNLPK